MHLKVIRIFVTFSAITTVCGNEYCSECGILGSCPCDPNHGHCVGYSSCMCVKSASDNYHYVQCSGHKCIPACQNGGQCTSPDVCTCENNWEGSYCETPICNPPCQNGGQCTSPDDCFCTSNWEGSGCETPICNPPCQNGGQCTSPDDCTCNNNWEGSGCETPICNPPCQNGGQCTSPDVCTCTNNWEGSGCDKPICNPPCQNGGQCTSPDVCTCTNNWEGSGCETPICNPPCQNGGQCTSPDVCTCTNNWEGSGCDKPKCSPPCQHGGECVMPGVCTCDPNWAGNRCKRLCTSERLDLTIIVDLSYSMTSWVPSMTSFLRDFVATLNVTAEAQHVNLITFSSDARVVVKNATNTQDLLKAINDLKPSSGLSNMAEALQHALNLKPPSIILTSTGRMCPGLSTLILTDGLSNNRLDVIRDGKRLKEDGMKVSFVRYGDEGSVFEEDNLVSGQTLVFHNGSPWNETRLKDLKSELFKNITVVETEIIEADCPFWPDVIIVLVDLQSADAIHKFEEDFLNVYPMAATTQVHIVYPRDVTIASKSPTNFTYHRIPLRSLSEMLSELKSLSLIGRDETSAIVIMTDQRIDEATPLFRQVWKFHDLRSKVMSVSVGREVNNYMVERLSSVPRYAFAVDSSSDFKVPLQLWPRLCESCGFTSTVDLIFLVEASSATFSRWKHIIQFLISATDTFPVGRKNMMISIATFGQSILSQINFNNYKNKIYLMGSIPGLQPHQGPADVTAAVRSAKDFFSTAKGGRSGAKKVLVLLTTYGEMGVHDSFIKLHIQRGQSKAPMFEISRDSDYLLVNGFGDLLQSVKELHTIVCKNI